MDEVYGARPMKRYIQKNIETLIAYKMVEGVIEKGQTVRLDVENDEFIIKTNYSVTKGLLRNEIIS